MNLRQEDRGRNITDPKHKAISDKVSQTVNCSFLALNYFSALEYPLLQCYYLSNFTMRYLPFSIIRDKEYYELLGSLEQETIQRSLNSKLTQKENPRPLSSEIF